MTRELARQEKKETERIEETEKDDGVLSKNPEDIQEKAELKQNVEEADGMCEGKVHIVGSKAGLELPVPE